MNWFILLPIVSILLTLAIFSLLIINRGYSDKQSRVFLLFVFALIFWSIGDVGVFSSINNETALAWSRVSSVSAIIITSLLLHYSVLYYRNDKRPSIFFYLTFPFILIAWLYIILFTDFVSVGAIDSYWGKEILRGPLYTLFSIFISSYIISSLLIIFAKRRKLKTDKEKTHLRLMLWGMSLTFVIGFLTQAFLPIFGVTVVPLSSSAISILALLLGYGIIKYKLLVDRPFEPKSIQTRIFWSVLLGGLTLIFVSFLPLFFYQNNTVRNRTAYELSVFTRNKAVAVEDYIDERKLQISTLTNGAILFINTLKSSENDASFSGLLKQTQTRLESLEHEDDLLTKLSLINEKGIIIASSSDEMVYKNVSKEKCFLEGLSGVYVQDIKNNEEEERIFSVSSPVVDTQGNSLGVLVGHFAVDRIDEILTDRYGLGTTGETYLVNKRNEIISPLRYQDDFFGETIEGENIDSCIAHGDLDNQALQEHHDDASLIQFESYHGDEVVGGHAYVEKLGWCLLGEVNRDELTSELNVIFSSFAGIMFGVMLILSFLASLLGRKISRPIKMLNKSALKIADGDFKHNVSVNSRDEVGILSKSFNKMTKNIMDSRKDIDKRVKAQTENIEVQKSKLEKQQKAVLNILEDVEEEKYKAEQSANELEKFMLAVENASDHIVITDIDGNVIYANDAVEKITGFSSKEVIGKKAGIKELWGGLMDADYYKNMWDTIKIKKKVFKGEIRNKKKNGDQFDASVTISPVFNSEGEVIFFVGIERDITHEKDIDRAKTEFVSLASHQLRTPLSSINWYAEMLMDGDVGNLNKDQKKYMEEIYKGNQRMVDLVNALLNVSRLELGTFSVEPEDVDIKDLAMNMVKEITPQIKERKQKLKTVFDKGLPKVYKADKKLLAIIFQNFLSNASKYTQKGGSIDLAVKKLAKKIRISVKDNGYGIPKSQHEKIFSKLFRADNVREKDTEGTGLGLYIIRSIVEHSGGKTWFTSAENKGTTFYVELPLSGMKEKKGSRKID